ncbi:hypothetical protein FKP32DRAFT_1556380, partial [Trametes sanguinea]
KLATLRVLLSGLPPIVPFAPVSASVYNFHDFSVSDDDISDLGLLGAVNRELEVRLGDRTKRGDTFELRERGPGVEALADVLQRYIETFPGNTLLEKWIDDACRAAHIVYADAGVTVSVVPAVLNQRTRISQLMSYLASHSTLRGDVSSGSAAEDAALPSTAKRSDTKVLESYEDSRYPDAEEDKDSRAGGGKIEPLLLKVSRPYIDPGSDKKRVRSTLRNLTLSFDGGKTRRPHGIYTVSITIAESRKSYLVDLNDASRVSHTARYIVQEVLKPVLEKIPPENVSAVVSDNTGNTRKSRELLLRLFPHILNFQDCCHEMNLALLQINELAEFKDMVQDVKEILSYMHHSTYAMEEYNKARSTLKISTGLAHIGATRFWTYVSAVESVFKGLPAFRALLVKYLAVTTPFARAIKCLESAHATASDVYAYWVAIMSRLEFLMSKNSFKLQTRTMEDIRAIANQRFNELLEDGPEDVYLAAFFLDPRMQLLFDSQRAKSPQTARDQLIARIGKCLQGILLREYGGKEEVDRSDIRVVMEKRNPLLAAFSPVEAYEQLRSQLYAYADKESPFKRQLKAGESVLQWWMKIQKDDDAKVLGALAIKIFSVVPHSMADERIMSTITWLNSARRSGQHVHTIADHLTIRQ